MDNTVKRNVSIHSQMVSAIETLNNSIVHRDDRFAKIEQEYPGDKLRTEAYNERKQRLELAKESFEKEWILALSTLNDLCKRIRMKQPHLNKLSFENFSSGVHYPDVLAFGRLHLTYQNWEGYIPRLIHFPFKKSFWIKDNTSGHRLMHQLLLRLFQCMPVGTLEVTAVDPLSLGKSLAPFLGLLKINCLFPGKHLLTRSDEVENALGHLTDYVENLLQNTFNSRITNWYSYNKTNHENPLVYKLLIIYGVPEQLTDKSLWYIGRLLEHGPSCGVLPLLAVDEERLSDRKYECLRNALDKYCKSLDSLIPSEVLLKLAPKLTIVEEREFWPDASMLSRFLESLSDKYEQHTRFDKCLTDLWGNTDYWTRDSIQGIQVPIGWTEDGQTISFSLGGVNSEHHVLLAGRSGSGKSNLLHVLIHSLCHAYSPSELNIYLLDYKQGTEFNAYASPPLPQAKLVATESSPEYGITVLTYLINELGKRAKEFKRLAVTDFRQYRESATTCLPRILLVIDEFQVLFEERQTAEPAEKMLNQLLRQGRSYGIHVLLSTQTLKGIQSLSMGQLTSQIGCRIALACSEEDSAMILGNSNWEASKLSSPPEGILNNSSGAKSANQKFMIPYAQSTLCKTHLSDMSERASHDGFCSNTKIFNGTTLPVVPDDVWFTAHCSNSTISLQVGEILSFEALPFSILFEKHLGNNLLIAGYNESLHDGLLLSIVRSLHNCAQVDTIIYYNAKNTDSVLQECVSNEKGKPVLVFHDASWDCNMAHEEQDTTKHKRIIIVDGLDSAKPLHSSIMGSRFGKPNSPPTTAEAFKQILEEGPTHGEYIIAFADSWGRCNSSCKELLASFGLRIGYQMKEDEAGVFIAGSIGKFKGLEKGDKAVFADTLRNKIFWIRPYICQKGQEIY